MPQSSLEQEAMDRVRRMYASYDNRSRRAEDRPETHEKPAAKKSAPDHLNKPGEGRSNRGKHASTEHAPGQKASGSAAQETTVSKKPNGLLELLMQDQDQSLILLLLVLLMKDGADMNLLLALMYLLI